MEERSSTGLALTNFSGPVSFGDFVNLQVDAVRGKMYKEMGVGVRGLYDYSPCEVRVPGD